MSKSGLVSTIWEAETKRGMWALLGEAYSDMRDHHTVAIRLEEFLALAVPLLRLIPAALYLVKMGWMLTNNSAGETELSRDPNFSADLLQAEYPARTGLSAADIVNHCYQKGLANRAHRQRKLSLREINARARMRNALTAPNQIPPPSCGALTLAVAPQSVCLLLMRKPICSHLHTGPDCCERCSEHCYQYPRFRACHKLFDF